MTNNSLPQITQTLQRQRDFFGAHQTREISFRLRALKKLRKAILVNEKAILEALWKDLHKSAFEGYTTEIGLVLNELDFHIRNLKSWTTPQRVPGTLVHFRSRHSIHAEPYGVSLIMAPWNYPFQLLINPLVGSISAGNCSFLKPSPDAVHTSDVIETIIKEHFNEEYISIFTGGQEVYQALLNERFDYIFFTGSPAIGKIVMTAAAKNLTPVTLELGGKSPCIVDKDANIPLAARRIVWGKFINAGQTCIAPDYLYVHKDVKECLIHCMIAYIEKSFGQDPRTSPDYSRIINERHFLRLKSLLASANIITGGETYLEDKFFAPTIVDGIDLRHPLMKEEIFGPILPVFSFEDILDVLLYINSRPKPLVLYYFSGNRKSRKRVVNETSSGGVVLNDTIMHIANIHLPFGGVGESGMGRYHGKCSFDTFSNKRAVLKKATWIDVPLRYLPARNKLGLVKRIMGNRFGA